MRNLVIFIIVLLVILFWAGSLYGEEAMTDGQLSLELTENMANFHYDWETEMTASVPANFCNSCIAQAEDADTKLMCYNLFCQ